MGVSVLVCMGRDRFAVVPWRFGCFHGAVFKGCQLPKDNVENHV